MNKPAPLSQRQYEYMQRCMISWFNVAEGGKRGGKNVLATMIFCSLLETHKNKIHLVAGVSNATAKLNILDCDGYGLLNYFEGRHREGKYKDRDCVYVQTKTGEKIVLISGGGKDGDEKLIKGNTYGMAYVTEANECHPKSKKYPDFVKETGYGTVTGLKGANCTHDFYPYWEGASIIPEDIKEPDPRTIGGKTYTYYESTQKQRQMERQIRATKREIEAIKSIGGDAQDLQNKLRGQMADYKSFSKAAGLKERDNRLRLVTGTSNLVKTVTYQRENKFVRSKNRGIINSRNMANGMRQSPFVVLEDEQIEKIQQYANELDIPVDILSFNTGTQTGFVDGTKIIHIRGDIIPDKESTNNRDLLSEKAVLAHEYYGHYMNDPSQFRIGDWRDEFRASYSASINAPGLTDMDRRMLMLDAYDRAKEAGVPVKYNKNARRIIYGYDE